VPVSDNLGHDARPRRDDRSPRPAVDQQSSRPGTPKTRFVVFAIAPRDPNEIVTPARGLVERPPEELFLRLSTRMPANAFARFMTDAAAVAEKLAADQGPPAAAYGADGSHRARRGHVRAVTAVSRGGPR
jgi:hypothetical protein